MEKKYILLCLVLFLFAGLIYPEDHAELKGKVNNQEGIPLSKVRIELVGSSIAANSLEDGTFILKGLKTGSHWLLFTCPGYIHKTIEIEITERPLQEMHVTLQKEEEYLPSFAEVITVTDQAPPDFDITLPTPKTKISATEIQQGGKENLAQIVQNSPGISMIGKGGYSLVPSIRGLARNRILLIIDGVKLESERRTGPSGSFINLNNIQKIEINRGPYSVFYGSDAIGGIINITTYSPRPYAPFSLHTSLGYKTINQERAASLRLSGSQAKTGYLLEFNGKKAGKYSSPTGVVEQSHYSDYDIMLKLNHAKDNSIFNLMLFHYEGENIGKPAPNSDIKPTWYPKERNTIFNVSYQTNQWFFMDTWNFSFYYYPSLLKTRSNSLNSQDIITSENFATVQGSNFGLKAQGVKALSNNNQVDFGIDFTAHRGVRDSNISTTFNESGDKIFETETVSLNNAERNDVGLFLKNSISLNKYCGLTWGARLDYIKTANPQTAGGQIIQKKHALTGFFGSIFRLTPGASIALNVGKAFRYPSLSELYYHGLTGRGTITGNANLLPEKSLNFDVGFRYLGDSWYMGIYAFSNSINQIIERYSTGDNYFYENFNNARISGIESEFYLQVSKSVQLSANFHHFNGKETESKQPLNDIPASRLFLAAKWSKKKFQLEPRITFATSKNNPGSLEIPIEGYILIDTRLLYNLNQNLQFLIIGSNLLNQNYRATADSKGVDAPGRSVAIQLYYSFTK